MTETSIVLTSSRAGSMVTMVTASTVPVSAIKVRR
jgi:hypothetical protein